MAEAWQAPPFDDISTTELVTAAQLNAFGNSLRWLEQINYTQTTSNVSVTGTGDVDILSSGSISYDAGDYWVEFFAVRATAGASNELRIAVFDSTTEIGRAVVLAANAQANPCCFKVKITLTAASHTIKIVGYNGASQTSTISGGAGGTDTNLPAWMSIYRVVPT